jgi:hypothetical protein
MVCTREIQSASASDAAYPTLLKKTVECFVTEIDRSESSSEALWMELVDFLNAEDTRVPELESGDASVSPLALENDGALDTI